MAPKVVAAINTDGKPYALLSIYLLINFDKNDHVN